MWKFTYKTPAPANCRNNSNVYLHGSLASLFWLLPLCHTIKDFLVVTKQGLKGSHIFNLLFQRKNGKKKNRNTFLLLWFFSLLCLKKFFPIWYLHLWLWCLQFSMHFKVGNRENFYLILVSIKILWFWTLLQMIQECSSLGILTICLHNIPAFDNLSRKPILVMKWLKNTFSNLTTF